MKKLLLATMASLFLAGCFHAGIQSGLTTAPATSFPQSGVTPDTGDITGNISDQTVVILTEQNESGQGGTAVLREVDGQVVVTITTAGEVSDTPQPAHLHLGACPNPGAVKYQLNNVVNGASTTTLAVDMDTLQSEIDDTGLAINIHESAQMANVYVACGDLKRA